MQSTKWYAKKRKDDNGFKLEWKREEANLRNPMMLFNYIEMEKSAYNQYTEEIKGIREDKQK